MNGVNMIYPVKQFIPTERLRVLAADAIANDEVDTDWYGTDVNKMDLEMLIRMLSDKFTFVKG